MTERPTDLRSLIRDVPDFPKPGILYKDITPLLGDVAAFRAAVDALAAPFRDRGIETVVAPEARGFLFGVPLALTLGAGFVPVRKPGKLPYRTVAVTYDLEYGQDTVQMHVDAIKPGRRVLLVDDVLATGGTIAACRELVEGAGAEVVALAFLVELGFLGGRSRLGSAEVFSLLSY